MAKKRCVLIIVDGLQPIYEDMMYMVMETLESQGHPCQYEYYHLAGAQGLLKNDDTTQCYFFGTKFTHHSVWIPPSSYLMDFDHAHWIEDRYTPQLVQSNRIITHSSHMMQEFRQRYGETIDIGLFQFGYAKRLDYGYAEAPTYDYDLCFLGTMSDRRRKLLAPLQERYRCFVHSHVQKYESPEYCTFQLGTLLRDEERANLYKRCKIVLSLGFTDDYLQNTNASRIFPAVCTGAFVIAERCRDEVQNLAVDDICVNTPTDKLYEHIHHFLQHDSEREQRRRQYYERVKNMKCSF